jgi:O-methyltransferase involved in polyketide biosynthesis
MEQLHLRRKLVISSATFEIGFALALLDTRFERVCSDRPGSGRMEWYDLDLPEVIELRRKLVGGEGARHHFMACSVFDSDW